MNLWQPPKNNDYDKLYVLWLIFINFWQPPKEKGGSVGLLDHVRWWEHIL